MSEENADAFEGPMLDSNLQLRDDDIEENTKLKSGTETEYIAYTRRWFILALFIVYSASNAFNWLDLVIISNVLEKY